MNITTTIYSNNIKMSLRINPIQRQQYCAFCRSGQHSKSNCDNSHVIQLREYLFGLFKTAYCNIYTTLFNETNEDEEQIILQQDENLQYELYINNITELLQTKSPITVLVVKIGLEYLKNKVEIINLFNNTKNNLIKLLVIKTIEAFDIKFPMVNPDTIIFSLVTIPNTSSSLHSSLPSLTEERPTSPTSIVNFPFPFEFPSYMNLTTNTNTLQHQHRHRPLHRIRQLPLSMTQPIPPPLIQPIQPSFPPTLQPLQQPPVPIQKIKITMEKTNGNCTINECAICYETVNNMNFVALNCKHEFCKNCIKTYLNTPQHNHTCPMCREPICHLIYGYNNNK
jgi:hypothetical protein